MTTEIEVRAKQKICQAAAWLHRHKWTQGSYYGDKVGLVATEEPEMACAVGALRVACDTDENGVYEFGSRRNSPVFEAALDILNRAAREKGRRGHRLLYPDMFSYNDAGNRKKSEVRALMREVGECES